MRRASPDDYEHIKYLVNHPKIRRFQSDTETELEPVWLNDPRHIILFDGSNAMVFEWRWIGIYEVHILYTASGREAVSLCRPMLQQMFDGQAQMLLAVIPSNLRHVILFARRFGFVFRGEVETVEGLCEMYQLESTQWVS